MMPGMANRWLALPLVFATCVASALMNLLLPKFVGDWFGGRELETAMGLLLPSWPGGPGNATAALGGVAAATSWRTAMLATSALAGLGLLAMLVFREAPR